MHQKQYQAHKEVPIRPGMLVFCGVQQDAEVSQQGSTGCIICLPYAYQPVQSKGKQV